MKKLRIFVIIILICIAIIPVIRMVFRKINTTEYYTPLLISGEEYGITFDNSYKVYLVDSTYGKVKGDVYIEYDEELQNYKVNAKFLKEGNYTAGITTLILEDLKGNKSTFNIDIWLGVNNPDGGPTQNVVQIRQNLTNKVLKGWKKIYSEIKEGSKCTTMLAELQ